MIDTRVDEIYQSNNLVSNATYQYELCKQLGLWNLIRSKYYHLLLTEDEVFEDLLIKKGYTAKEIVEINRLKHKIKKVFVIYGIDVKKAGKLAIANYKRKGTKRMLEWWLNQLQRKHGRTYKQVFYECIKEMAERKYGVQVTLQHEQLSIYQFLEMLNSREFYCLFLTKLAQVGIIPLNEYEWSMIY